ncbi:M23 family metallopeptidase [Argonema antarcticum]|uniref:M23 family metallopeptidase n=1 Tax=Argonema antarcticum TaxID=2942763 RepID=UPI0020121D44|nr:M23 family metallopeptidase [Argonema antarcticum]MCL1474078.1 M23 family metallopeptidase [Argonema antarcticum A004/B2]
MRHLIWLLSREPKHQKLKPSKKTGKRLVRFGTTLFFVVLGLVTFLALGFQAEKAKAMEIADSIMRSNLRDTSFPVENFQRYSSAYGYRLNPDGSAGWGFHRGIDIAAPAGSYIRSWSNGEVVEVANDRLCGTKVVVKSGSWQHIYCHLKGRAASSPQGRYLNDPESGLQIWEGQQISAGNRIGRVGTTGRTTGPHLHWGLKYYNTYVDPGLVLQAMYRQQN